MTFLSSFVCVHPHENVCMHHAERPIKRCEREKQRNRNKKTKNATKMEQDLCCRSLTVSRTYLLKSAISPRGLELKPIWNRNHSRLWWQTNPLPLWLLWTFLVRCWCGPGVDPTGDMLIFSPLFQLFLCPLLLLVLWVYQNPYKILKVQITPQSNFQVLCLLHLVKCGLVQANLSTSSSGFLCPFICSCLAAGETCSTLTSGHSSNQLAICRKSLHNSDIFPPRQ